MKKYLIPILCALVIVFGVNEYVTAQFGGEGAFGMVRDFLKKLNTNIVPSVDDTYNIGSSTKRIREIYITDGLPMVFTFKSQDMAASYALVELPIEIGGLQEEFVYRYTMPYGGSVVGISIYSNTTITAGILSADATINGVCVLLTADISDSPSHTTKDYKVQNSGIDTFSAGDTLGVIIGSSAIFAPTTADISVVVIVGK